MPKVLSIRGFRCLIPILAVGITGLIPGKLQAQSPPPSAAASSAAAAASSAMQMIAALDRIKAQGKLCSNRTVTAAVRKVVADNSVKHDLSAPRGARVLAVHKRPGDFVQVGEKIVTLEVDGKPMPILAKQSGVMQTLNYSKGGVIGNTRPRAVWVREQSAEGLILISPILIPNI